MFNRLSLKAFEPDELRAIRHLCLYEGEVNHLYLDSKGNPTIGAGFHIPNKAAFANLPLRENRTKRAASRDHKLSEFDRIKRLPPGYAANFYTQHCELYLSHRACQKVLQGKINQFKHELMVIYGESFYQSLPRSIKLALLDMIYNLGQTQLQTKWPKFNAAIQARDWQAAALECHRVGVSAKRNERVKQLLMSTRSPKLSWWHRAIDWFFKTAQ
ncbi:hypothetical protein NI389_09990 [Pseudoalteromonas xiamenensis]|uniref:hypothetical protein n=1 Tax=Pseudoalteromonas xiamenensis TaxID=882626 RepID=UPI0027E4ADAF|nr:hypothetical protein [Pseudoalteromonas xiamenensis]WMN58589.1 hypothetical protein NI389_09990 [Pseudoalteromonas xiamenensis]